MANHELEGRRPPEHLQLNQEELSHEALVRSVRYLIGENQKEYDRIRSPKEREVLPPETVIRNVLDWYSGSSMEQDDRFFTLRTAWDALNYDRYEAGSREEGLSGSILQAYAGETGEDTVKLTDPRQIKLFDAMAEAAGISRELGQAEIQIPENARRYNQYLMSGEYQQKLAQAKAKKTNR